MEKRLQKWVDQPNEEISLRIANACDGTLGFNGKVTIGTDSAGCEFRVYSIIGSSGTKEYNTTIGRLPESDCMDFKMRNTSARRISCKHIKFALIKILGVHDKLRYQEAFLSTDLERIFSRLPKPAAIQGKPKASTTRGTHGYKDEDSEEGQVTDRSCSSEESLPLHIQNELKARQSQSSGAVHSTMQSRAPASLTPYTNNIPTGGHSPFISAAQTSRSDLASSFEQSSSSLEEKLIPTFDEPMVFGPADWKRSLIRLRYFSQYERLRTRHQICHFLCNVMLPEDGDDEKYFISLVRLQEQDNKDLKFEQIENWLRPGHHELSTEHPNPIRPLLAHEHINLNEYMNPKTFDQLSFFIFGVHFEHDQIHLHNTPDIRLSWLQLFDIEEQLWDDDAAGAMQLYQCLYKYTPLRRVNLLGQSFKERAHEDRWLPFSCSKGPFETIACDIGPHRIGISWDEYKHQDRSFEMSGLLTSIPVPSSFGPVDSMPGPGRHHDALTLARLCKTPDQICYLIFGEESPPMGQPQSSLLISFQNIRKYQLSRTLSTPQSLKQVIEFECRNAKSCGLYNHSGTGSFNTNRDMEIVKTLSNTTPLTKADLLGCFTTRELQLSRNQVGYFLFGLAPKEDELYKTPYVNLTYYQLSALQDLACQKLDIYWNGNPEESMATVDFFLNTESDEKRLKQLHVFDCFVTRTPKISSFAIPFPPSHLPEDHMHLHPPGCISTSISLPTKVKGSSALNFHQHTTLYEPLTTPPSTQASTSGDQHPSLSRPISPPSPSYCRKKPRRG